MPADMERLRLYLQDFDLPTLMVEGLGWNHHKTSPVEVRLKDGNYTLQSVAEKAGFVVYSCVSESVPLYHIRRKIERWAARTAFEHMIVFADCRHSIQIWQWVRREESVPDACREMEYHSGQHGDPLLQRLRGLYFSLEKEENLRISDVTGAIKGVLDVEKVTKRFYESFKRETEVFRGFIEGIATQGDKEWYASLMLNRMMFVYFVQKQGFLDGDPDYLRNRLRRVRAKAGRGRFQQFYRLFLLRLFHEGLARPEADRAPELADLLGKVPYLNGGLFDIHDLERDNQKISIPDEAFEKIFKFFDEYSWNLDWRPRRKDNEINPDVLGHIFEKYINQKQMGAYYTKEDITGYISRNTVIPFLFDAAIKECPVAFNPGGGVWGLLQDDPDRYIYPAVGHGAWQYTSEGNSRLEGPHELPEEIAAGVSDISKRDGWNRSAPSEYALPTETWREVIARCQRYSEVRSKLAAGEIQDINDLITLNLDVEQFAKDVIVQSEGPELLRAFWHAISAVSILDPTCGSGAFLFAALNVIEPLYVACLEGMRGFLDDLERSQRPHRLDALEDFRDILDHVEAHPNRQYYVLKSIVINNLYGVDIMEEAVEICKLRLFLKLAAQLESYDQIEPLPDIDFNIRAGNTLVGFSTLEAVQKAMLVTTNGQSRLVTDEDLATLARINETAEIASQAFDRFRNQQIVQGKATQEDKTALRSRLDILRDELDSHLAAEYGVAYKDTKAYGCWRASHQPFHWFVEFHGIMSKGGFDVVIGNPPYVQYRPTNTTYTVKGLSTLGCGDLFAYCCEQSMALVTSTGRLGVIVPISMFGADGFSELQQVARQQMDAFWVSSFGVRPQHLFQGVDKRLSIVLGARHGNNTPKFFTTKFNRWNAEEYSSMFQARMSYTALADSFSVLPSSLEKIGSSVEASAFSKLAAFLRDEGRIRFSGEHNIYYTRNFGYFLTFLDFVPRVVDRTTGTRINPTELKSIAFKTKSHALSAMAALNSSTFYWYCNVLSDCRNLNRREILPFVLSISGMSEETMSVLCDLGRDFLNVVKKTAYTFNKANLQIESFDIRASKSIIDEIDQVLAGYYGFTNEELDFIINYDIKYRMGQEGRG